MVQKNMFNAGNNFALMLGHRDRQNEKSTGHVKLYSVKILFVYIKKTGPQCS